MDKAALLTDIFERNASRRQAQLPLLDVREELSKACSLAAFHEWEDFKTSKKADWDRIEAEVLQEMRAENGPQFPSNGWSRMAVQLKTEERFKAYAELHYGTQAYDASLYD